MRVAMKNVVEVCDSLNRRMENRKSAYRYSVCMMNGRCNWLQTDTAGSVIRTIRAGTKQEIFDLLYFATYVLDDSEYPAS